MSEVLFVSLRGETFCRACNSENIFTALNLGELPIANELTLKFEQTSDKFPLTLMICQACGLGQVGENISPVRLFQDYRYQSSTSSGFSIHAKNFVSDVVKTLKFEPNDYVLELASNDGYLLKYFKPFEIKVLGVEPARNIASQAIASGIPTISDFFGTELAKSILNAHGQPRLIVANNVLAHVPDIQDFVRGLSTLTGENTLISIENPRLRNILDGNQFDTIYHEHFSYLSCKPIELLVEKFGLSLYDLDVLSVHGGSNRYWIRKKTSDTEKGISLLKEMAYERNSLLFSPITWKSKSQQIEIYLQNFRDFVGSKLNRGENIYGYGAAAKASTLINASGIPPNSITAIADASPEKIGRYMPSLNIPIISPEQLVAARPDNLLIFPWNISEEIMSWVSTSGLKKTQIWQTIPDLRLVELN
jgi:hypothetical protein